MDSRPENERLIDVYGRYFHSVAADTDALRKMGYRLRYDVYCVEHPFEDPAENPDEMERDEFDARSAHSLLLYRPSGTVAGTVRLILPRTGPGSEDMPIRRVCGHPLLQGDSMAMPASTTAEVSRFAVSRNFRRRSSDRETTVGGLNSGADPRRMIPHISLGLMQAIVAMAAANGVTHLCALMEPPLLRLLQRLGIHFDNLGAMVDYHGKRQPCYADLDQLLARTWLERRDVWELLTVSGELWPVNMDRITAIAAQSA